MTNQSSNLVSMVRNIQLKYEAALDGYRPEMISYKNRLREARDAYESLIAILESPVETTPRHQQPSYVLEQIMNNSTDPWAKGVARTCLMGSSVETSPPRLKTDEIRDLACCDTFVRESASEFCATCGYTNVDHLRKRAAVKASGEDTSHERAGVHKNGDPL